MENTTLTEDEVFAYHRGFVSRVGQARTCALSSLLLAAAGLVWSLFYVAMESQFERSGYDVALTGFLQAFGAWLPAIALLFIARASYRETDEEYAAQAQELSTPLNASLHLIKVAGWAIAVSVFLGAAPLLQTVQVGAVSSY